MLQVGIIRQVEVELDNTLRDLRDSHREESSKLRKWRVLDKDLHAKLAELGELACLPPPKPLYNNLLRSHMHGELLGQVTT